MTATQSVAKYRLLIQLLQGIQRCALGIANPDPVLRDLERKWHLLPEEEKEQIGEMVLQSQRMSIEEAARKLDIASQTYYPWSKEYGDMNITQARKLKDLEKENLQLKKLAVDLSLDNAIMKKVLSKK